MNRPPRPQFVFRPNLRCEDDRRAWQLLQAAPDGNRKALIVRALPEGADRARAVMVGDRKGDFLAGRDNGLPTVSACYGYGLPDEWALADRQAYSVEKLQNMLLDFTQGGD